MIGTGCEARRNLPFVFGDLLAWCWSQGAKAAIRSPCRPVMPLISHPAVVLRH